MDSHGVLGMEVLVGSSPCSFSSPLATSDLESVSKRDLLASHFLKLGRSGRVEEDDQRCPKISRSISNSCVSNGEQMLSFSSPKSYSLAYAPLPSLPAASSEVRSAGLSSEGLNVSLKGAVRGSNGPFTLFQKMELQQQMLIYNHIWANVPIPTNLLCSLIRGLNPTLATVCPTGSLRHNAAWWGYIHPGYVGNADPEPGRCCRTDGKKWRCSRDAVPDQKYCERHINRGRHRSRKPVEGHGGHAKKSMPVTAKTTQASAVCSVGHSPDSLTVTRHQSQNSQTTASVSSSQYWNSANNRQEKARDHCITSTAKPFNPLFASSINYSPLGETPSLALDSDNALMNNLRTSFVANSSLVTPLELHNQQNKQPTGQFIDDWLPPSFERTQPPVPFPLTSSGFSSSTSSPGTEGLSPLHMGLGLIGIPVELNAAQMNWKAAPWEAPTAASASMGGPLGEALASKSSTAAGENKGFLNLINDGWDLSPQVASSASNAMQSTTVSSVSSGSANDDNVEKNSEGLSCLFGPKVVNSMNLPPFVSI